MMGFTPSSLGGELNLNEQLTQLGEGYIGYNAFRNMGLYFATEITEKRIKKKITNDNFHVTLL